MTKHIVVALVVLSAALSLAAESIQVKVYRDGSNIDYDILNFEPIAGAAGECRLIKKTSSQNPYGYNVPQMTVPEYVTDKSGKRYTVTEVGMEAFANSGNIYAVTLPESVRLIDVRAFSNCAKLRLIILSQSLEEIMPNAFKGCGDLQEVVVPMGCKLNFIGDNVFEKCNSLISFTIPEGVTYIGSNVFEGSGLKTLQFEAKNCRIAGTRYNPPLIGLEGLTVKFGEGVRRIPDNLFAETGSLTAMDIPSGITDIGEAAFLNCVDLESVTISPTVTTIGSSAFEGCVRLRECDLTNVQTLGIKVFKGCSALQSVRLNDYLMEIPDEMFMNCTSLPEFKFPSRVMLIGERAFYNCRELVIDEKGDLPEYIYQIKAEGFRGCTRLTFYPVMAGWLRDYALSATGIQEARLRSDTKISKAVFADCKSLRTVTKSGLPVDEIPDSLFSGCTALDNANMSINVTEIGAEAFRNCTALSGVRIPTDCIAIGNGAFKGCTGITAVTMNELLQTIGIGAFSGCVSLQSIIIPNGVRYLYSSVFDGCVSLASVNLGYGITSIQADTFNGCNAITSVTANSVTPPAVADRFMPQEVFENADLSVPFGQKNVYSNATGWKNFKAAPEELDKVEVRNLLFTPNVHETGIYISVGESFPVSVTVVPANASDQSLRWVSADESTAKVTTTDVYAKRASIRGLKPGTTKVTVSASGAAAGTPRLYIINVSVAPRYVEQILLSARITMTEGTTRKPNVLVLPANATDPSVKWSSSDETVVKVSDDGEFTALKPGQAVITVTAADGSEVEATCNVTVVERVVEVESITLDASSITLTEGDTHMLTATVSPDNATVSEVEWSSSDDTVVSVAYDGTITAIRSGEAVITVTAADASGVEATCKVTVEKRIINAESIELDSSALFLTEGDTHTLTATVGPAGATDRSVTWRSSDESVATVDSDGTVTAMAPGDAVITAIANGGTDVTVECAVKVRSRIVGITSLAITPEEVTDCTVGDEVTLRAVISPADATSPQVVWSVSDYGMAEILSIGDAACTLRLLAPGSVTITVTAATPDGASASASAEIVIERRICLVESVDLSDEEIELTVGSSRQITAVVGPEHADNRELIWKSSDTRVATVGATGLVTAVGEGETDITAAAADGSGISDICKVRVVPSPAEPDDPGMSGIAAPGADSADRVTAVDLNGHQVYCGTMAGLRSLRLPHGLYIVIEGQKRVKILL